MRFSDAANFLTYEELSRAFKKIHYTRPGWSAVLYLDPWEGPVVYFRSRTTDGMNPDADVDLGIRSLVPPMKSEIDFFDWFVWREGQIQWHESREFIHVNGTPWIDPHDVIEPPEIDDPS